MRPTPSQRKLVLFQAEEDQDDAVPYAARTILARTLIAKRVLSVRYGKGGAEAVMIAKSEIANDLEKISTMLLTLPADRGARPPD